jgi:NADPH2 dehydrogenase
LWDLLRKLLAFPGKGEGAVMTYRRIASLKTIQEFLEYTASLGIDMPFNEHVEGGDTAPLAQPLEVLGMTIGNRFTVLPMEGWDGTLSGKPTDLTFRRWQRFGESGAKLVWGGEAVAVRHEGRANPNQLFINWETVGDLEKLRETLVESHQEAHGRVDDLVVGLQLTHSGRYSRPDPDGKSKPRLAYDHPLLNKKMGLPSRSGLVLADDDLEEVISDFIQAAILAREAGYNFIDIKHCHGYLGHELLSAVERTGKYGGSFENRTRFLRQIVDGVRREAPGLEIGVRLSAFDFRPFKKGADGVGQPDLVGGQDTYPYTFGGGKSGLEIDMGETEAFLSLLQGLDIRLLCLTAGCPYYNPHIQRPALFPPSDGYLPPEDPLVGVARQIEATARLKKRFPGLVMVGSAYSYLQEWLPNVAQAVVRNGMADSIGLGRMMLSYPLLPADVLSGKPLKRKQICRTFSDCTTAPRKGLVSGCYPLDEFYKGMLEAEVLRGRD